MRRTSFYDHGKTSFPRLINPSPHWLVEEPNTVIQYPDMNNLDYRLMFCNGVIFRNFRRRIIDSIHYRGL